MQKLFRVTVDISKKIPAPAFEVNTNDLKSVKLEITITNGQSLLDLTDVTPRINIRKPDNEVIFQDCEIVDAAAGKVQIVLENQAYLVPGTHTAEIACYKGNEITAITGTFSYKSVKGIMNDKAVESKSEFTAINRTIQEAERILEDLRENGGGAGVDQQARQKIEEVTEQLAENLKFEGQADFVNLIKDKTKYNRLRVRKNIDYPSLFDVILDDGKKFTTYDFTKNAKDDFIIFNQAYVGDMNSTVLFERKNAVTRTGTWNTSAPPTYYTTQVGASFTTEVNGTEIRFGSNKDNRGGVWEFIIDGDANNPVTLSTFSSTGVAYQEQIIKSGLTDKTHTVVATFKGDDPANPPSSGAGTSRGWVWFNNDDTKTEGQMKYPTRWSILGYKTEVANSYQQGKSLLGYGSNKEFAIEITKGSSRNFFPEHNGIGTAFKAEEPQYILDGNIINVSGLTSGQMLEGKTFQLIQKVHCKFPNVTGNIAELKIISLIGIDGVVSISGKLTFLQSCTVNVAHPLMMPLGDELNEVATSIGNSKVNAADESAHGFSEEANRTYSFAGLNSSKPNYICAMSIDYPNKTLRIGQNGHTGITNALWFRQRVRYPKVYTTTAQNFNVSPGESFSWHGRFIAGEIPSIYDYIK